MKNRHAHVFLIVWIFMALAVSQAASSGLRPAADAASDAAKTAIADTRTYLQRLEKLGFAGIVLVAKLRSLPYLCYVSPFFLPQAIGSTGSVNG